MANNTPLSPRPLSTPDEAPERRLMTARALRAHGVSTATANERCRPGGPWQLLLPGVYVLHSGPPTSDERLHAALLYAGPRTGPATECVPSQPEGSEQSGAAEDSGEDRGEDAGAAMVTGAAALALYGFDSAPSLRDLDHIDVLVPRTRRLRSTGCVRVVRGRSLPHPRFVTGLPVAPAARAVADALAREQDAVAVRRILVEAVRAGHCEPAALVQELRRARLLGNGHVADAVEVLHAEGRALAEARLYDMVFRHMLPEPFWNVELRLPGGPALAEVDAYWPQHAVAVQLDTRMQRPASGGYREAAEPKGPSGAVDAEREVLERLGISVVQLTPQRLREALGQQAAIVRTALITAAEREPAEYVAVLPR